MDFGSLHNRYRFAIEGTLGSLAVRRFGPPSVIDRDSSQKAAVNDTQLGNGLVPYFELFSRC